MAGGAIFAFIPVWIGALAGITDHDAGVASGLLNTSQQIGGAIGVAVASTVAASRSRVLLSQGHAAAAALTGGFQQAFWVTELTALAAVPVTFLLIRRAESPARPRRAAARGHGTCPRRPTASQHRRRAGRLNVPLWRGLSQGYSWTALLANGW